MYAAEATDDGTDITLGTRIRRVAIVLAILAFLSPILVLAAKKAWVSAAERMARRPFDAAAWRADTLYDNVGDHPRLRMVDDLLDRRLLAGRTIAEMRALLGAPVSILHFEREGCDAVYPLGPERDVFPDAWEYLCVGLGPDGRVASATLMRT